MKGSRDFMRIAVYEILDNRFPISEVVEIIVNVCVLLFMQFFLFEKDMQKQYLLPLVSWQEKKL